MRKRLPRQQCALSRGPLSLARNTCKRPQIPIGVPMPISMPTAAFHYARARASRAPTSVQTLMKQVETFRQPTRVSRAWLAAASQQQPLASATARCPRSLSATWIRRGFGIIPAAANTNSFGWLTQTHHAAARLLAYLRLSLFSASSRSANVPKRVALLSHNRQFSSPKFASFTIIITTIIIIIIIIIVVVVVAAAAVVELLAAERMHPRRAVRPGRGRAARLTRLTPMFSPGQ